jgi:ketosteroid isomerase-like protein
MRTYSILLLCTILMIHHESGHGHDIGERGTKEITESKGKYKQVTLNFDQQSPNVDIRSYVLITDNLDADRVEAEAIMRLRAKLPLAVQTKDAALFNSILGRDFTFRAADEFWNREEYIRNRVEDSETVLSARYENVVLQLFGDVAVSTYRNAIELKDKSGKAARLEMTWASMYVKEDGQWKIGAVHLIDKK